MTFEAPRAVWRFCAHILSRFCAGRAHGRVHGLAKNVKNACVYDRWHGCGATATVPPACRAGDVPGVAGVARTREALGDHGAHCCGFFVAFHVHRAECADRADHDDPADHDDHDDCARRTVRFVRIVCTVCIYRASRGVCLAIGRDDYRQRGSRGFRIQTVGHGDCDVPYLRGQL